MEEQDPFFFRLLAMNLCVKAQTFSPHVAPDTENMISIAGEKITPDYIFLFFAFILKEGSCVIQMPGEK